MDKFISLRNKALNKLNESGLSAKSFLIVYASRQFFRKRKEKAVYGVAVFPEMLSPYVEEAISRRSTEDLISWFASHGGYMNMDLFHVSQKKNVRNLRRMQTWICQNGVFLPEDEALVAFATTLNPESEEILKPELFEALYKGLEKALERYLDGDMSFHMAKAG